jgi:hypothetical protein
MDTKMDTVSRRISTKFDLAERVVALLLAATFPAGTGKRPTFPKARGVAEELRAKLAALRARCAMCSAHLLFGGKGGNPQQLLLTIANDGAVSEAGYVVTQALRTAGAAPPKKVKRTESRSVKVRREMGIVADQFRRFKLEGSAGVPEHIRLVTCDECGVEMTVHPEIAELSCPDCHVTKALVGAIFTDAQFYDQEGQKAKSGSYNQCRHLRFWLDHILAREPCEEIGSKDDPENARGEKLIESMRGIVKRDQLILRRLTIDDVRRMLSELGKTNLNQNASLILKLLTGIGPPDISEELYQRIIKIFVRVATISGDPQNSEIGRNHYPNAIYKIVDAEVAPGDHYNRGMLYYIYLQKQDTLDENELKWGPIHETIPDVKWRPIIRAHGVKYRPRDF